VPEITPKASITNNQGILIINDMLHEINQASHLSGDDLVLSISTKIKNIRSKLKDGAFFSAKMQNALGSWHKVIMQKVAHKETVQ